MLQGVNYKQVKKMKMCGSIQVIKFLKSQKKKPLCHKALRFAVLDSFINAIYHLATTSMPPSHLATTSTP